MNCKAVIFDLDDTLISEKVYIRSGYRAVSRFLESELPDIWEDIYARLLRLFDESSQNVFNRLLETYHVTYDQEDILELVKVYREHIPEITFHEDVMETLLKLRENKVLLGILSDGYTITQRNKLKVLNAESLFDKVILTDELGREFWKPDPRPFQMFSDAFSLPFEKMMYVGDNPEKDFYIKKTFPIQTARIYREDAVYQKRCYRENIKEDISLHDLRELLQVE